MEEVTVSVLIPTYNREDSLKSILTMMVHQETGGEFSYEVLVVDDLSSDNTVEVVKEIAAWAPVTVRYILEEGKGYTHVLNRAVQEFHGQWLAFFDDDQMCDRNWLQQLFAVTQQEEVGIVGGPICVDLPQSVLAGIGPVCRNLYGETPDIANPELFEDSNPLSFGGNRMVARYVFEQLGTFDESMLTGGCDRDFLLRAEAAGVPMGWAPGALGRHQIPDYRFTYEFIKWYSLQFGISFAHIDEKRWSLLRAALGGVARVGQALLVNLPLMIKAKIQKNKSETLDRQALLWRAVGYNRRILRSLAPRLLRQEAFFAKVEFRRGRETDETN